MHLNQQSCVIFYIFARTSSLKDSYFLKSGYNSQCSSFSKTYTHTHTHKFPSHMPLNWKLSFGPFSLSQNLLHINLCLWSNPAWNQLNIKAQYFHVLSIFASRDEYYSKETSSQDAVGGLPRLPSSLEHVKMVVWPLFVFHLVTGKSPSVHHCTMVALFSFPSRWRYLYAQCQANG